MNNFKTIIVGTRWCLLCLVLVAMQTNIAVAKEKDCWVDFYEFAQYVGETMRVEGPVDLPELSNIKGDDWSSKIDSLIVGPKAKVILYKNTDFKLTLTEMAKYPDLMRSLGITEEDIRLDSELIFSAGSKIKHLGMYNFHKLTKSLKVSCE
ncbi:MAG: hypothetical protein V3U75_02775 [Methylococcaceae bacterium]